MRKIILIFAILIGIQLIFSFLFPSYDDNSYWSKIEDFGLDVRYSFDSFDNSFIQKIRPLISRYHMNLDVGGFLLLAHDFPRHYFEGNYTLLTRPVYSILVNWMSWPLHLISDSYSMTFAAGLILNYILFLFTVYLFYSLLKKFISSRVAFLSSLLLIFSPLVHIYLVQPETNIFGIFSIILSLYLLDNYFSSASLKKLIIFSLVIGILLLGKKLFAISIFILILAFFFKRYKEGIIFFVLHLLPLILWSFWITRVWGLPFYDDQVSRWGVGIWLFNIFSWPWHQTIKIFIDSIPQFVSSIFYSFLVIPILFIPAGFKRLVLPRKNILIFGFIFSYFILFFITQVYFLRYGFWLFPVIYPLAVLGIDATADFLRKYSGRAVPLFYVLTYALIIIISSLNIYKFVNYA
ncbi:MAG: glycosyltransferase family 39 protein [Candidatus Portnoybacteria bacterium]